MNKQEKIENQWNKLSFLCLYCAKKENRKDKKWKYSRELNDKNTQRKQAHNKEKIKTDTKCLRRQFVHHTGIIWNTCPLLKVHTVHIEYLFTLYTVYMHCTLYTPLFCYYLWQYFSYNQWNFLLTMLKCLSVEYNEQPING